MKILRLNVLSPWSVIALVVGLAGCGGDSTGPEVVFQVIEETTFAPSLNIDLPAMELLGNGVYRLDIVEGTGDQLTFGMVALVTVTGWLSDGTQFQDGQLSFLMGNNDVARGFEDGILGMNVGGTRRLVIPPNLGFGGRDRLDGSGNVVVPAGSILIFNVTLDEVVAQGVVGLPS